jgi:RraA family protein
MTVGNRVFLKLKRINKSLIEEFSKISTANIADTMNRSCSLNPRIRLFSSPENSVVAGTAITVKARNGDNLFIHQALDQAEEGDIVIISNEGERSRALVGEVMVTYACKYKKLAALILDGAIRDVDKIAEMDFPVYATGSTPDGPYKDGPGEINVPITCGGLCVMPGDLIVADADGVIVIPHRDVENVLEDSKKLQETDQIKVHLASKGMNNRNWIMKKLIENKVEIIDDYYH